MIATGPSPTVSVQRCFACRSSSMATSILAVSHQKQWNWKEAIILAMMD
jgi:hypothetical protein